MSAIELDATDWKILARLQEDARLTNVELARRVNLSPSLASRACDGSNKGASSRAT